MMSAVPQWTELSLLNQPEEIMRVDSPHFLSMIIFKKIFFWGGGCAMQYLSPPPPHQESSLHLQWEGEVLTTGPPEKSLKMFLNAILCQELYTPVSFDIRFHVMRNGVQINLESNSLICACNFLIRQGLAIHCMTESELAFSLECSRILNLLRTRPYSRRSVAS